MDDDQLQLWELTLESLLETLESSETKVRDVRIKLEKISRDIVELKATIEGMVATAKVNVEARIKQLDDEYNAAK